jgi:hypothetical protein
VKERDLINNGKFSCAPVRVGSSILLCGKKRSFFPFHCLVGPDWPVVILVYLLIISINVVVLAVVSPLGWPPVLIGSVGALALLYAYSAVSCSDPGIIFKNDCNRISDYNNDDIEDPLYERAQLTTTLSNQNNEMNSPTVIAPVNTSSPPFSSSNPPTIQQTMDCGSCEFKRPHSSRHCQYCEVCIDELDHHCPWCGKCIGKKNLKFFYLFINLLCVQVYYLIGVFIYYLLAVAQPSKIPRGPSF